MRKTFAASLYSSGNDKIDSNDSSKNNNEKKEQKQERNQKQQPLSGSFFNPVPTNRNENNEVSSGESQPQQILTSLTSSSSSLEIPELKGDPFDESVRELLRRRKSKPLASEPSTIDGIPTSKATGK